MELIVSNKIVNKYRSTLQGNSTFALFKNIKDVANKNGVQPTYTSDLPTFLNKMISDLNNSGFQISPVSNLDSIRTKNELDMYVAEVVDGDTVIATVVIANANKPGNTLITQQLPMDFLKRVREDSAYITASRPQKICYLTFDIHSFLNNLGTLRPLLRATLTLGYRIIEMFPTGKIGDQYKNVEDLLEDLQSLKRNGNDPNAGIELRVTDQGNNELILTLPALKGQTSKYYGFFLLAIYTLNHPKLVYIFRNGDTADGTLSMISNLYNRDVPQRDHDISTPEFISLPVGHAINKLIYGAPGTGKSFEVAKQYPEFDRVTFYPDYDFSQFIGGLKPTRGEDDTIDYQFVPGPFTNALVNALNEPQSASGIIIEELNRANVAAVFGEVFQLLDRNSDGVSRYPITDPDLADYIDNHTKNRYDFRTQGIRIPGNFSIIATMNPADQGVYPVDAAFKRRWEQEYCPINWEDPDVLTAVLPGFNLPWPSVGKGLNDFLSSKLNVEEDALFGQFFFTANDNLDIKNVSSKILGYLWNNVARYNRQELFDSKIKTLAQAIDALRHSDKVFVDELEKKVTNYGQSSEPKNP